MKIHIQPEMLIRDIQEQFNAAFPYLKIEFFRNPHAHEKLSSENEMLGPYVPLKKINPDILPVHVDVSGLDSVAQLEEGFHERLDLNIQVFRKSGRSWIETSLTDDWSLQKQNEEGMMMSSIHNTDTNLREEWEEY